MILELLFEGLLRCFWPALGHVSNTSGQGWRLFVAPLSCKRHIFSYLYAKLGAGQGWRLFVARLSCKRHIFSYLYAKLGAFWCLHAIFRLLVSGSKMFATFRTGLATSFALLPGLATSFPLPLSCKRHLFDCL